MKALRFTTQPVSLTLAQTHGASLSPGGMSGTVGLVRTREALLRATSSEHRRIVRWDGSGLVVNCVSSAGGLSGTASDLAMFGDLVVRGQPIWACSSSPYNVASKTLTHAATFPGSAPANASTGVAVAFVADGFPPTAPVLIGARDRSRDRRVQCVQSPPRRSWSARTTALESARQESDIANVEPDSGRARAKQRHRRLDGQRVGTAHRGGITHHSAQRKPRFDRCGCFRAGGATPMPEASRCSI